MYRVSVADWGGRSSGRGIRPAVTQIARLLGNLAILWGACFSGFLLAGTIQPSMEGLFYWYGIGALGLIVSLCASGVQIFGPAFVVALYTILTHFGWPLVHILDRGSNIISRIEVDRHAYVDYLPNAFAVSFLACAAFIAGLSWTSRPGRSAEIAARQDRTRRERSSLFGRSLISLCQISVYGYALNLIYFTSGTGLLNLDYAATKDLLGADTMLSYLQKFFWVACALLGSLGSRRDLITAAPAGVTISVILLLSGNRNDILYPLAAALAMYVLKARRIPLPALGGGLLVLIVLNPWIADSRGSTSPDVALGWRASDAVVEMGGQVRPLTMAMWLVENRLPWMLGMSILLPTVAVLSLGLVLTPTAFRQSDYYVANLFADLGHTGQGFSMIGELWLNFSTIGVVVAYVGIGILLGRLERSDSSRLVFHFYSALTVFLIYWVRNSLDAGVIMLVIFVGLYGAAYMLSSRKADGLPGSHGPVRRTARDV